MRVIYGFSFRDSTQVPGAYVAAHTLYEAVEIFTNWCEKGGIECGPKDPSVFHTVNHVATVEDGQPYKPFNEFAFYNNDPMLTDDSYVNFAITNENHIVVVEDTTSP